MLIAPLAVPRLGGRGELVIYLEHKADFNVWVLFLQQQMLNPVRLGKTTLRLKDDPVRQHKVRQVVPGLWLVGKLAILRLVVVSGVSLDKGVADLVLKARTEPLLKRYRPRLRPHSSRHFVSVLVQGHSLP